VRRRPGWILALVCWPFLLPLVLLARRRALRRKPGARWTARDSAVLARLDRRAEMAGAHNEPELAAIRAAGM
jgi:hypothetical protein